MRACAAVLSFLFAVSAFPSTPSVCSEQPVLSVPFRLSMLDVAVDGNDLWAATSYGIALYDRSVDPPRLVASTSLPGTTRIVRLSANGSVVAGSGNMLWVVRKNGSALQAVRSVDAGATINDIAVGATSLFVATRNGIAQFSLVDSANPSRTTATFPTSHPAVTSLAIVGPVLYAADGDSNIAAFDLTTLQPLPSLVGPPNTVALHALNGKLLASSLLQTTIFVGTIAAATLPQSIAALAPISGDAIFVSSGDRTLRGLDLTTPGTPFDLFRDDLPPTSGTVNRINALATAGGRLYVAAGDIGLVSYDISNFAPFPMRGASFSGGGSIVMTSFSLGDRIYIGTQNGVTEFNSALVQQRTWDGSHADTVWDAGNGFLLTSSGATMTLWTLLPAIPTAVATTTFPAPVKGAVLIGTTTAYAVIATATPSLMSADFSQQTPIPQAIVVPVNPSSIARSGTAIALAGAGGDGTTTQLAYLSSPSATAHVVTIPGLPSTPVALSGTTAAVQTYQGISVVDFGAGTTSLLPGSNDVVAQQLVLSSTSLLELTTSSLRVWNTQSRGLTASVTLPSNAVAVNVLEGSSTAAVTTTGSVVTIALDQLARMPLRDLPPNGNEYYKKVTATPDRIYLAGPRGVDIFTTSMRYRGSIRSTTIVDVAATEAAVFTISSDMTLSEWARDGSFIASTQINGGADAQPVSVFAVDGAAWVSYLHGCTTGACDKETLVFHGVTQTSSMAGGVVDVVTNGSRAYAITDIPSEVRVIDISDPLHPSILASAPAQSPLSIAYSPGTIYVLGNTLTPYSEAGLTKGLDLIGPYTTDGTVTLADQHLRIDATCAVLTGRTFAPQQFAVPAWTLSAMVLTPSPARFLAFQPGTFYVLTDHSLEIWSNAPLPIPARRRPAR